MNSITQELKYKQSIVKYVLRNGVTAASTDIGGIERRYIDG